MSNNKPLSKEITVADFINTTNRMVGTGIIPTGEENFKLAKEYAKQECIEFLKWFWFESKLELSNNGIFMDMGDDENYKYYSWDETYSLYLKHKGEIEL